MSKITVTTIAGQTSGSDANLVKIESGDTLQALSNATVGGTLGVTGATTLTGDLTVDTSTLKVDTTNNRVLIGTTTEGAVGADQLTIANSGNSGVTIRAGTSSSSALYFSDGTSGTDEYDGYIAYNHGARTMYQFAGINYGLNIDGVNKTVKLTDGGTQRLRIDNDGIKFATDSAAANALDDYEEGAFTPNFSFTTTNGNHTVSGATGHYVKVGNLVNIQGYIKLASKGTASGQIRIASLPFTNINSGSSYAVGSLWANGLVNGQPMDGDFMQYAIINPGGDHIRLWAMTGTGSVHEANQGDVQDQSDFMFTVSYRHA